MRAGLNYHLSKHTALRTELTAGFGLPGQGTEAVPAAGRLTQPRLTAPGGHQMHRAVRHARHKFKIGLCRLILQLGFCAVKIFGWKAPIGNVRRSDEKFKQPDTED